MKSGKKFLIPLILAVIFLAVGAGGGIYINSRRAANVPPDHYFARSEHISSVTDIVGERSLAQETSQPAPSQEAPQTLEPKLPNGEAAAEGSPEKGDPAKGASEKGDSAKGDPEKSVLGETVSPEGDSGESASGEAQESLPAETEAADASPETKVYRYQSSESARADVDSYIQYLKTEKHFIDVTDALAEDEKKEGGTPGSAASAGASSAEQGERRIHRLAGASQDSDSYLSITITEEEDGYTVTTVKENQPWAAYFTQLWDSSLNRAQLQNTEPQPTLATAEETVRKAGQELLKLPAPVSEYEFIAKRGLVRIDGNDYYCVSAYRSNDTETFDYECAYLLDASSGKIMYQYDEATGDARKLR